MLVEFLARSVMAVKFTTLSGIREGLLAVQHSIPTTLARSSEKRITEHSVKLSVRAALQSGRYRAAHETVHVHSLSAVLHLRDSLTLCSVIFFSELFARVLSLNAVLQVGFTHWQIERQIQATTERNKVRPAPLSQVIMVFLTAWKTECCVAILLPLDPTALQLSASKQEQMESGWGSSPGQL